MTDKEEAHSPRRRDHAHRARPNHSRIYQHLGVRDLREIIDRKRSERALPNECSVPPPDPSFNYLKDPLREEAEQNFQQPSKHVNSRKAKDKLVSNFKRGRDYGGHTSNLYKQKDIENPINIKVEFSISTGEHAYQLDESIVLPTIKHVPDHPPVYNQSFRGRGRGRGRGPRSYQTRTIRNNRRSSGSNAAASEQSAFEQTSQDSVPCEENLDDDVDNGKEVSKYDSHYQGYQESKDVHEYEHYEEQELDERLEENVGLEKKIQNLKLDGDDSPSCDKKGSETI